MYKMYKCDL